MWPSLIISKSAILLNHNVDLTYLNHNTIVDVSPLVFSIIKTKHRAFKGGIINVYPLNLTHEVLYGDHHCSLFY
jgi:hypothetical protein